jgi:hypothetical protein
VTLSTVELTDKGQKGPEIGLFEKICLTEMGIGVTLRLPQLYARFTASSSEREEQTMRHEQLSQAGWMTGLAGLVDCFIARA